MASDVQDEEGVISVAGFGSLLSESSARSTFPDLRNFRAGKVRGYRRIFAHTASVFFQRHSTSRKKGRFPASAVNLNQERK